jgi:hypothetical protein
VILEFYTKNRVSNGRRLLEILPHVNAAELQELKSKLPRYELAPEVVRDLNKKGHSIAEDGFVSAFSLSEWHDRARLETVDSAVEARTIPEIIRSRGYEITRVEIPEEVANFMQKHQPNKQEDFFEIFDLVTCHLSGPIKVHVTTRHR